ncbi:MAG: transposase, partial [Gemmataceae bacterium]|nr:transposase [Gemmataceae bacterium]
LAAHKEAVRPESERRPARTVAEAADRIEALTGIRRAASGRRRSNVLGACDAVARELASVTDTTFVNALTMRELLGKIAARGLAGPVAVVPDNARYRKRAVVREMAERLGIGLLHLPSYSPNPNRAGRLWRFIKREALLGRWHAMFAGFESAIEKTVAELPGKHREKLAKLMTLNFQVFEVVSLLAPVGGAAAGLAVAAGAGACGGEGDAAGGGAARARADDLGAEPAWARRAPAGAARRGRES